MSYKLILRSKNSPFTGQFTDTNLGSVLSHADLDNNFINVKGNLVYTADTSGTTLTMYKVNGGEIDVDLSGLIQAGDTFVSGATMSGDTLVLTRTDGGLVTVSLSGLSNEIFYTNSAATPTSIGGIGAGSTFSAQTMQEMWDALLYPYQYPAFTSFARTNLNGVYELGEPLVGGNQTFTWSISNSTNVAPNTVTIVENQTANILMLNGPHDGTELLPTSAFTRTTAGTTLIYTISAQNTLAGSISTTISKNWRGRWYYGMNANTSVTDNDITGGTMTTALTTGVVNSYITWTPSGPEYGYLIIPNYLPQPSDLKDSVAGCFGTNIPYNNIGTTTFNNAYGVSQTYNIYRTVNAFNSPVNTWLCV